MDTPSSRVSIKIGAGFFGAVFAGLLVLKLTGIAPVAAWSWWRVTAPLWGPWALGLALLVLGLAWAFFTAFVRFALRR